MAKSKPIRVRFEALLGPTTTTGCREWAGRVDPITGYGMFALKRANGKWAPTTAHRVSYELYVGPIPDGLVLDHLCRNRKCINPEHLDPVTQGTNFLRSDHPSAVAHRLGLCKRGHPLEGETKRERECSKCRRLRRPSVARRTVRERIDAKVRVDGDSGCWLWTGALSNGYAAIRVDGKSLLAHRVAYEMDNGPIPAGARLGRSCPRTDCVNPNHARLCQGVI